jgi:hypothetical protein
MKIKMGFFGDVVIFELLDSLLGITIRPLIYFIYISICWESRKNIILVKKELFIFQKPYLNGILKNLF